MDIGFLMQQEKPLQIVKHLYHFCWEQIFGFSYQVLHVTINKYFTPSATVEKKKPKLNLYKLTFMMGLNLSYQKYLFSFPSEN